MNREGLKISLYLPEEPMTMRHAPRSMGQFAFGPICLPCDDEKARDDVMATLIVSVPDSVKGWIEDQVGEDGYASADGY